MVSLIGCSDLDGNTGRISIETYGNLSTDCDSIKFESFSIKMSSYSISNIYTG